MFICLTSKYKITAFAIALITPRLLLLYEGPDHNLFESLLGEVCHFKELLVARV